MPTTTKSTNFFGLPPLVLLVLVALTASLMTAVVLARPAQAASLTVTTPVDELNERRGLLPEGGNRGGQHQRRRGRRLRCRQRHGAGRYRVRRGLEATITLDL